MYKKLIILCLMVVSVIPFLCLSVYGSDSDKNIDITKLSLVPAKEPVPALSYRLLPRYIDQKTGNAALFYYSAAGLYPVQNSEEVNEKIKAWRNLPFEQLDRKDVEEFLKMFSTCFRQIELAAQRNSCQWEMPIEEGFSMHLPNLSAFRQIIYVLQLKIRIEIADGNIDNAIELLQQGMYMSRCIAEGPTIIQNLVGISIDAIMLKEVENLIQQSNCPNLYWALSSLPKPLIDMQKAIQYEHETIFMEFPELKNIENEIITSQHALDITTDIIKTIQSISDDNYDDTITKLLPTGFVLLHYSDAKKYLSQKGFSEELIEKMPAAQVVLIYQKQQYGEISDDIFKWLEIPFPQSQPYIEKSEKQLSRIVSEGVKKNIFSALLPALSRVVFLQARLERTVVQLRIVEAIRMYAADNSGQLPDSLTQITLVPIPADPVTGKEFIYHKVDKQNARLEAPASSERSDKTPVYELTIKK